MEPRLFAAPMRASPRARSFAEVMSAMYAPAAGADADINVACVIRAAIIANHANIGVSQPSSANQKLAANRLPPIT